MRKSWVRVFHFPSCFWGFPQMVCGQIESVLEKRAGIGVLHRGQRGLTGPVWGILSTACTIFAFFFFSPPSIFCKLFLSHDKSHWLTKEDQRAYFSAWCDSSKQLLWQLCKALLKECKKGMIDKAFFSEASEVSLWKRAERHECSANDSWKIKYLSSGFEQANGWHDGLRNEFDTE